MSSPPLPLEPASADRSTIADVRVLPRVVHQDPRGSLVETLRADDHTVEGNRFVMSYTSITLPGEFRDRDRWHLHAVQTDRFVVPVGEMLLALYDGRKASPTHRRFELLLLAAPRLADAAAPGPREVTTHLVTIPPGVLHCIGNRASEPFVLQNFPTELYSKADEERIPFSSLVIPELHGPFRWGLVAGVREPGGG